MIPAFKPRTLVLFIGDIVFFTFSLWLSLFLRGLFGEGSYQTLSQLFFIHLYPFSFLFIAWVFVFFVAGLYENRSIILERRAISASLLISQTINMAITALFFFFVPLFGIAPKTLLFIYLVVSFLLVLLWRTALFPRLTKPENAIVVGSSHEVRELVGALTKAHRAPARIAAVVDPATPALARAVGEAVATHRARFIIADSTDARVSAAFPELYNHAPRGVSFSDALTLYEEVFGRVPLSVINEEWVARNISRSAHTLYDSLKRLMDIIIAIPAFLLSLIFYPFIIAALKIQDGGPAFISMPRVGEGNKIIHIHKFRSMTGNDAGDYGKEGVSRLSVTSVGRVLRLFRLDEIPQLWEVILGNQSLIGPRPETPTLVAEYAREIPYYNMRHLVKPGLSGWAQLYHDNHPHHGTEVEATREKLSYDLYYIKHRSLLLDLVVALKTIKKLLTHSGK